VTTFNDRLTLLRVKLEEETAGVWDDDALRDSYNQSMRTVVAETDPPEFLSEYRFNTVAGTRTYALTASATLHRETIVLYHSTNKMYRERPYEWSGLTLTATGTPEGYAIVNASLYLRPVPGVAASMVHWYKAWPTALTATGSTIEVPNHLMPAVEARVLAQAFEQVGDAEASNREWTNYERFLHDARNQQTSANMSDDFCPISTAW